MKTASIVNDSHISPRDNAILDEFLQETNNTSEPDITSLQPQEISPESLLTLLKDAKALVVSLNTQARPETKIENINSRLTNLEAEIGSIKSSLLKFINQ
jgi:hypothetical protein